jgi:hypothetical protein
MMTARPKKESILPPILYLFQLFLPNTSVFQLTSDFYILDSFPSSLLLLGDDFRFSLDVLDDTNLIASSTTVSIVFKYEISSHRSGLSGLWTLLLAKQERI